MTEPTQTSPDLDEAAEEIGGYITDKVTDYLDSFLPDGWHQPDEQDTRGWAVDPWDTVAYGPDGRLYRIDFGDITLTEVDRETDNDTAASA